MYWYAFVILITLSVIVIIYKRRRISKFKSDFNDINDIARRAIIDNEQIAYLDEDIIFYFGSIVNNQEEYLKLKQLLPLTDVKLQDYFKNTHYSSTEDCLNIYKLTKFSNGDSYIIVIDDPVDMNLNFSLFEILGPFNVT